MQGEDKEKQVNKENKIVMTELMGLLLKPQGGKDQQMAKAYQECFLLLTKTYYQSGNTNLIKFLAFTYKELLKTFLGGRLNSNAVSIKLFQSVFEQNPAFGWEHLLKVILKCIVSTKPKGTSDKPADEDDLMGGGK